MADEFKIALFYGTIEESDPPDFEELTAGPGANKFWEVDVIFVCSRESSEISVSLKHIIDIENEVYLLKTTSVTPGETVSIGPIAMIEGHSLEVEAVGGSVDLIGYGTSREATE